MIVALGVYSDRPYPVGAKRAVTCPAWFSSYRRHHRHRNLTQTVQSHSPPSGAEHAPTGARDSISKWYIDRELYTGICVMMLAKKAGSPKAMVKFIRSALHYARKGLVPCDPL